MADHLQLRLLRPRQGPSSQQSSGDGKNCFKESILIIYVAFSVAEGVIYVLLPVIRYFVDILIYVEHKNSFVNVLMRVHFKGRPPIQSIYLPKISK